MEGMWLGADKEKELYHAVFREGRVGKGKFKIRILTGPFVPQSHRGHE